MGDEHLDTILEIESNEVIKSSVEDLVPIPIEYEDILDNMCDVPFSDKNHFDAESDLIGLLYNQDPCYEQNFVDHSQSPPQPQYEMYACELYGNDAHYGYDCPPQHAQPEDTHELLRKLLEVLQLINEELAEYINSPSYNRPVIYDDDDDEYSIQVGEKSPIAIALVLPTEEHDNSLRVPCGE
nr:hypothetical protein [Tanacetum cinerariifolium]